MNTLEDIKLLFKTEIDGVISEIESDMKKALDSPKKYAIPNHIDIDKMSVSEKLKYQLEHGIIYERRIDAWTEEYKAEALGHFSSRIYSSVLFDVKLLRRQALETLNELPLEDLILFLNQKIRELRKLVSPGHGDMYCSEEYRTENYPTIKTRFDAIWFINQYNDFRFWDKRISSLGIGQDSHYPFVLIDTQEWIDYEKAYRLIPLLKGLKDKIMGNPELDLKDPPIPKDPSIFHGGGESSFYKILLDTGAISEDESKIILNSNFRGVCGAFFREVVGRHQEYGILRNVAIKRFIEYLNRKEVFNAKIASPDRSIIANPQTIENSKDLVEEILKKHFPPTQ